jgi:hypothetical protein
MSKIIWCLDSKSQMHLDTLHKLCLYFVADEEFDELCFDFGIELDEVVQYCIIHVTKNMTEGWHY